MKRLYIILFAALGLISATAQQATSAEDALRQTAAIINGANTITGKFTIAASDGSSAKGDLCVSRQCFSMVTPDYGAWYDGTDLYSYYKSMGEVQLSQPTADELLEINPFDIVNNYSNVYNVRLLPSQTEIVKVEFTARSKQAPVTKAVLSLDAKSHLPLSIDATFSNGNSVKIAISDVKCANGLAAASRFVFPRAKYPGVPVIDLR